MLSLYVKARTALEALKDESGQDLIEYALLGALVAVVVAATIPTVTNAISGTFTNIANKL